MVNVAGLAFLMMNNRGGFGFGGGSEEENAKDRYEEIKQSSYASRMNGVPVLSAYLDGQCKLTAFGETIDVHNLFGDALKADMNKIPEYKAVAEKRVNMITPPSFMEKVMLLRRSMRYQKAGRALSTSTLGLSSVAAGMISVAARSYGKAKEFVLDKLTNAPARQSFSERLNDLKTRVDTKDDIKKLNKLEKAFTETKADFDLRSRTEYRGAVPVLTDSSLLKKYLNEEGGFYVNKKGEFESSGWLGGTVTERVPLEHVDKALKRTKEGVEMIPPASGTEKFLMKADRWLARRKDAKSVDSTLTQVASAVIGKAVEKYIESREKKDPSFKGKLSLYSRFAELKKRKSYQADINMLNSLHKKMTGR